MLGARLHYAEAATLLPQHGDCGAIESGSGEAPAAEAEYMAVTEGVKETAREACLEKAEIRLSLDISEFQLMKSGISFKALTPMAIPLATLNNAFL